MRLRRCHALVIEPRESRSLDLAAALQGQARLASSIQWFALAAHLDDAIPIDVAAVVALGTVSPSDWTERAALEATIPGPLLDRLIASGLVSVQGRDNSGEDTLRASHWHPLAAIAHRQLRWRAVDTQASGEDPDRDVGAMLDRLGPPPAMIEARCPPDERLRLDEPLGAGHLDDLAARRVTCRNFDPDRGIPGDVFATLLHRVHRARAVDEVCGIAVQKKSVPSAGGLHPVDACLLVRDVDGVAPGLYHYHAVDHALEPLKPVTGAEARSHARAFVAQQPWFVEAPVFIVLVARFRRNFWKYRGHAKAYRAVILDAGHLSQMQYLAATELGLGAFTTAAINEGEIEDAFGLDPMECGVLAVTGVGYRGAEMHELEFDPQHAIWPMR